MIRFRNINDVLRFPTLIPDIKGQRQAVLWKSIQVLLLPHLHHIAVFFKTILDNITKLEVDRIADFEKVLEMLHEMIRIQVLIELQHVSSANQSVSDIECSMRSKSYDVSISTFMRK